MIESPARFCELFGPAHCVGCLSPNAVFVVVLPKVSSEVGPPEKEKDAFCRKGLSSAAGFLKLKLF